MVVLCFLWGMGQVAAPLAAPRVSLMMQRAYARRWQRRSFCSRGACAASLYSKRMRSFAGRDVGGMSFAGELLFIFAGHAHTRASRVVVFTYLAPCLTASTFMGL